MLKTTVFHRIVSYACFVLVHFFARIRSNIEIIHNHLNACLIFDSITKTIAFL